MNKPNLSPSDDPVRDLPEKSSSGLKRGIKGFERLHNLWLLAAFVYAVSHLFLLRNANPLVPLLFLVPPYAAFFVMRSWKSPRSHRLLACSFLCLIGLGVLLSPIQNVFPKMNGFPNIPLQQSRILTWYCAVYVFYLAVVLPPFAFIRTLLKHRQKRPAELSRFTCYLGLVTWVFLGPGTLIIIAQFMLGVL